MSTELLILIQTVKDHFSVNNNHQQFYLAFADLLIQNARLILQDVNQLTQHLKQSNDAQVLALLLTKYILNLPCD